MFQAIQEGINAVTGAVAVYAQAQAAKVQAKYNQRIAENNKIMAERQAADATARGRSAELNQRLATKGMIGQQRAMLAANGVNIDAGSAADITSDTAAFGEYDALNIRSSSQREALGWTTEAYNQQNAANAAKTAGQNATAGVPWIIGTTLLTGAPAVADKWQAFQAGQPKPTSTPSTSGYNPFNPNMSMAKSGSAAIGTAYKTTAQRDAAYGGSY